MNQMPGCVPGIGKKATMLITECLGKRCLLKVGNRFDFGSQVTEYRVLEISPSGGWVKLMNMYGNKFWKPLAELALVEILQDLDAPRARPDVPR